MTTPTSTALTYLPLGGADEITMNMHLYGFAGKWVMVDCGLAFPDDIPGIEVMMPDPAFIAQQRENLLAVIITHAHEDHIGALPYLWGQLACPIWASPFAATVIKAKFARENIKAPSINIFNSRDQVRMGGFEISFLPVNHSVPETHAIFLRTPAASILHTSDWKNDFTPLVENSMQAEDFKKIGNEGVTAIVIDSMNAQREGRTGSEKTVCDSLPDMIKKCQNRVAVTCFASNIARMSSVFYAAEKNDRVVVLVGQSMTRMFQAAQENNYLKDLRPPITEKEAIILPKDKVLYLCTGSQGEDRAALTRIASHQHRYVKLEKGDTAIFSSFDIPGNEPDIRKVRSQLHRMGVEIITQDEDITHVSGHAYREEMIEMYQWTNPKIVIPVQGEAEHLDAQARLAQDCQIPQSLLITNGDIVEIANDHAEITGRALIGRLGLDKTQLVPLDGQYVKNRQRLIWSGMVFVTLLFNKNGKLETDPVISTENIVPEGADAGLLKQISSAVKQEIEGMNKQEIAQNSIIEKNVKKAVRRIIKKSCEKNPLTRVHIIKP